MGLGDAFRKARTFYRLLGILRTAVDDPHPEYALLKGKGDLQILFRGGGGGPDGVFQQIPENDAGREIAAQEILRDLKAGIYL